jgi:hypothetical protein
MKESHFFRSGAAPGRPRRNRAPHDGVVYQVSPSGNLSVYAEDTGVATGLDRAIRGLNLARANGPPPAFRLS